MIKKFFISAAASAAVMLSACGYSDQPQKASFFAMDTYMTVSVYGENASVAVEEVSRKITELGSLWSVTDEGSEIFRINHSGGEPVEISAETAEIIGKALTVSSDTDGALDCTIYPVLAEWGFTTGEYHIPDDEAIAELLTKTGYEKISLDGNIITVPDGTEIDLGALGKGEAGMIAAELLRERGVTSALLDLGGNIQTVGTKPDGSEWRLGLRDPFSDGIFGSISIAECAAVTSGGYERFFTGDDGKTYCHIIDPETGRPAESGLASVTVIGKDGALCDGLSTALFVLGADEAERLWRQSDDIELILVTNDREVIITESISEKFSLSPEHSDMSVKVLHR